MTATDPLFALPSPLRDAMVKQGEQLAALGQQAVAFQRKAMDLQADQLGKATELLRAPADGATSLGRELWEAGAEIALDQQKAMVDALKLDV